MFSLQNGLLPSCFNNMFSTNNEIHNYNTRNKHSYHINFSRTKLKQFSITYQGPILFNSIDSQIKNSTSLNSFTFKLKKHIFL